jgi:hypothetical protein
MIGLLSRGERLLHVMYPATYCRNSVELGHKKDSQDNLKLKASSMIIPISDAECLSKEQA